jgi:hypothetical protein
MCKYRSIIENPEKLRSMTGLTVEEFHALVPIFHAAFEAYMKRRTIDGHVRYCRRYVSYANSPLPTTEDKLLFILTYLKQNPTQVMHGHLFQGVWDDDQDAPIYLISSLTDADAAVAHYRMRFRIPIFHAAFEAYMKNVARLMAMSDIVVATSLMQTRRFRQQKINCSLF